jgi:excinuclease ABC subunit A
VHDSIEGAPTRTVLVDQARAGIRSPVSYLGLIRPIHTLYSASNEAKALGMDATDLGKRCTVCRGRGSTKVDMGFLPPVHVLCETCRGTGYQAEAWTVRLRGMPLPEVFRLTIDEVRDFFGEEEALERQLAAAQDVGLGYLSLRQPGHTLSGGEAQRLKIAKELCRRVSVRSLYILDEPTVGQHLEDVSRLVGVLHHLVDHGHTVVVIEHHPHVLAACDWLVELGPAGGPNGGRVIATGSPEIVAAGRTPTAPYLREILEVH